MSRHLAAWSLLLAAVLATAVANAATLTAFPASVSTGGSVTAGWTGVSTPTGSDWLGFYAPGAANDQYLMWRYTNGAESGTVPVTVPDVSLGTYELRLFSNNSYTLLASSNTFTVDSAAATLTASPTSVATGGTVTAAWSGFTTPLASAWLGLYTPGADDSQYLGERYANGAASDSVPFTIPDAPSGTYELRLFSNIGFTRLATSNSFTIIGASLSANPTSVGTGGQLTVNWSGIVTPTTGDWLGLYTPGSADSPIVSWRYTNGAGSGSLPYLIHGEIPPGTYELRLFANDSFWRLATSNSFTVAGAAVTLAASPSSVATGGTATAAWSGIAAPAATDWVAMYAPGADNYQNLTQPQYTNGAATGSLPISIPTGTPPGTYELRLFASNSFVRLATSNSFAIDAALAQLFYVHADHLNSPRAVYDANQQLRWKWDQAEPFGDNPPDENPSSLGAFDFSLRFPGQYADKETGLAYNMARDYASETGRYVQSDPIGLKGGINTYAYVNASPLLRIDPSGLLDEGRRGGGGGGGAQGICRLVTEIPIGSPMLGIAGWWCLYRCETFSCPPKVWYHQRVSVWKWGCPDPLVAGPSTPETPTD